MLRIRRSVQATYNTQVNFMASQMLKVSGSATGTGEQLRAPAVRARPLLSARPWPPGLRALSVHLPSPCRTWELLEGWVLGRMGVGCPVRSRAACGLRRGPARAWPGQTGV